MDIDSGTSVASMIKRFRGPPTSREEREEARQTGDLKQMWYLDNDAVMMSSDPRARSPPRMKVRNI